MEIKTTLAIPVLVLLCGCSWMQPFYDNSRPRRAAPETRAMPVPTMQTQVRMVYPGPIRTVGDAAGYMLEPHFYRYRPTYRDAAGDAVAERTFINNHGLDPVPLYLALQRLMGDDAQILLDQRKKAYAFRTRRPGEASVAFADLAVGGVQPIAEIQPVAEAQPVGRARPVAETQPAGRARPVAETQPAGSDNRAPGHSGQLQANNRADNQADKQADKQADPFELCEVIQFRNKVMLSKTVRDYLSRCGFDEVFWKLGKPGRYTDYQILHDVNVPLPRRHEDLIELLHTRFGIKTRIHDDNRIDFYDEKNLL